METQTIKKSLLQTNLKSLVLSTGITSFVVTVQVKLFQNL